ncbi:formimidoylglutamase [Halobacteria archaeon AArc-curdl1]|uniref:Formimidoylglutamase n=2 Tax=Natronosalvus hydrolyticus TaxID=2979988 RepID=A0AAP2Z8I3_9EURY|nr:formimidoylglutamase [Halobacteria archaeon AArc-curdl1]
MTAFGQPPAWESPSSDPNDTTFGDVVEPTTLESTAEDGDFPDGEATAAYDAVLVGEPYDRAVIGRQGASEGPQAIRTALAGVKTHHFDRGSVDRRIADIGDIAIPERGVVTVQSELERAIMPLYEHGSRPIFLGGDNSLTVPNVGAAIEALPGSVGVISLDAHLDCREPVDGPSSGTPYYQLHERGLDAFAVVGARHFETSSAYAAFVDEQGGTIVTADAVGRDFDAAVARALDAVSEVDHVLCSLDMDVLDATAAPGVSAPTPGGLTTRELYALLGRLGAEDRLVGFEVVECAPPLEDGSMTSDAAARAIAHLLSGWSR